MPRPKLCRRLTARPQALFYKPQGMPLRSLEVLCLTHEEWEALRLKYAEGFDQVKSAQQMATSQSTLQRILASAQAKMGQAVVYGYGLKIVGD